MPYLLCIVFTFVLAVIAEKSQKKAPVYIIATILSLFCGLRGTSVGVDTANYITNLTYIRERGILFGGSDIGYSLLSYIMMGYFDNPHYALLVFAAITNTLIILRLWEFKESSSFTMMVLIFLIFHYPYTFNIVRQYLAVSIIFWGTRYLERGSYLKYLCFVAIAASMHTSAILGFLLVFIPFGFERFKLTKIRLVGLLGSVLLIIIGFSVFQSNFDKYTKYFQESETSVHLITIVKTLAVLLVIVANRLFKNKMFSYSYCKTHPMRKEIPIIYTCGLLLSSFGMFHSFMNRIGFYFMMYEMPFWGQAILARKNRIIFILIISLMLIYSFQATMLGGADGLIDYTTFLTESK
jgi:hypothetical protein